MTTFEVLTQPTETCSEKAGVGGSIPSLATMNNFASDSEPRRRNQEVKSDRNERAGTKKMARDNSVELVLVID